MYIIHSVIDNLLGLFLTASYTKPKGQLPDYESPVVLKNGSSSIEDFCNNLHKSIMKEFKQWVQGKKTCSLLFDSR